MIGTARAADSASSNARASHGFSRPSVGGGSATLAVNEVALRAPAKRLDIAEAQSIKLDRPVAGIHAKGSVTYRVTFTGDTPLDKIFATDDRQKVQEADAKARTFDLLVTDVTLLPGVAAAVAVAASLRPTRLTVVRADLAAD